LKLKDGSVVELGEAKTQKALQYSGTQGLDSLSEHLFKFQEMQHKPPHGVEGVVVTTGSQDALSKVGRIFSSLFWLPPF
jgi:DNA-binding transcriptional MocR family regulator